MSPKKVLVVGAGTRVREAALPVLESLPEHFTVDGVFARSERTLKTDTASNGVETLDGLGKSRLATADLVYMAVSKAAVPDVLRTLGELGTSDVDLLIDTPVLLSKHVGHAHRLRAFRRVSVAEDCVALPCYDAIAKLIESGELGAPKSAVFHQSAYDYHALAMLKTWLGADAIQSAKRTRLGGGHGYRDVRLSGGRRGLVFFPRSYETGRFTLTGDKGSVSDYESGVKHAHILAPLLDGERCTGFRAGEYVTELDPRETDLMGEVPAGASVTSLMDGMKRVGLRRLFQRIAGGGDAYPLEEALEDMLVDWRLHKFGRYTATPLTGAKGGVGPALFERAMRLVNRD